MLLTRLWNASIHTRIFLRQWMPTDLLLDWLRQRRNLCWGLLFMLLGAAYIFLAALCTTLISHGWSEWLYLAFALFLYDGLKFLLFGPLSLVLLARARIREARARRRKRLANPELSLIR